MPPFRKAAFLPVLWLAACSGSSDTGFDSGTAGGNGNGNGSASGIGNGTTISTGSGTGDGGATGTGSLVGNSCAGDARGAEGVPLDMFVMFDQSLSMSCKIPAGGTRWDAVKSSLEDFINLKNTTGFSVGIQFFGQGAAGARQGGMGGMDSCNAADYETPAVEIAPLPGNAAALVQSINAHMPSTRTPTPAALTGAISHAKKWSDGHPAHKVIVVLVTDGQPNECGTVADVAKAAGVGLSKKVPTYVIGITAGTGCSLDPNPPNKPDLDAVASAGGTMTSFMVDATRADTNAQFLVQMNKIRGSATLPCEYTIPTPGDGGVLDYTRVNVLYAPHGDAKSQQAVLQVSSKGQCTASGGWHYDDPSAPAHIELCDATCSTVTADTKGEVQVLLGCQTQAAPIH